MLTVRKCFPFPVCKNKFQCPTTKKKRKENPSPIIYHQAQCPPNPDPLLLYCPLTVNGLSA